MPALIPLDSLVGAVLIGVVLSAVVYGVSWLQVYMYYTEYGVSDNTYMKTFVAGLLAIDTVHLAFEIHGVYTVTVTNFGDYIFDSRAPWSFISLPIPGSVVGKLVQSFYAYRIYQLSNQQFYMPMIIVILALVGFAFTVVFVAKCFQVGNYVGAAVGLPFSVLALSFEVACDVSITSTMVYYLLRYGRNAMPNTNRAIHLLVRYVINSGALALALAIACLVTFVKLPHTQIYAVFYFLLVHIYSCAFMTILNSRENIRGKMVGADNAVISVPAFATVMSASADDTTTGGHTPEPHVFSQRRGIDTKESV